MNRLTLMANDKLFINLFDFEIRKYLSKKTSECSNKKYE